ncbi:GntR family transcriptional regulator [Rhodococcus sp. AG1013]|uniref:MocR-like pyridoxine biosynthesis transcription factor PdxR n=1 Tax=Rhodococcus sp. AG1013 TaxID=2183996 RepID=UPI000E0B5AC0|nr:PLP-dependent aminotransferase family protein [Rhodococcus sp. AG1013]RDI22449.1 GntR family transcriptional regulator [Rhodococcus sp. AG1013]
MARTSRDVHLHLELAPAGEPLRRRVAAAIVEAVRTGALGPGDVLPASRSLAADLGISRTVVVDAYDELAAAGYVLTRAGSDTRIAPGADAAARAGVGSHVAPTVLPDENAPNDHRDNTIDLSPGYPDTGLISDRDWRSAWRGVTSAPVPHRVPGPDEHLLLREALAVHLRRTRGIAVRPDELVIVPGVLSALRALAAARGLSGRHLAFEEPGYSRARHTLESAGALVRPVPVDHDGLDPALIRQTDAAVYCTPAHQYPIGARMPAARRARLVSDALTADRLLIEDDYDGEFRYGVSTLPALRSIDGGHDCVAYVGTASKILSPALRLAWLVPPRPMLTAVRQALQISGESASTITSAALARFIESGSLSRHLARAARTYSARRRSFVDSLRRHLPDVEPSGVEAGLHVALRLPDGVDDAAIAAELERRGVTVRGLGAYRIRDDGPRGLLCGYARLPESRADAAARVIADVIRESTGAAAGTWDSCTTNGS